MSRRTIGIFAVEFIAVACLTLVTRITSGEELQQSIGVQSSSWETYINQKYGYSFQYPKNWYVEQPTELITTVRPWKREAGQYSDPLRDMTITVYPTKDSWQQIQRYIDTGYFERKNELEISGVGGEEMQEVAEKGIIYTHFVVQKMDRLYMITVCQGNPQMQIMGQILNSFKFIP